jgi:hypothetical protein
MVAYRLPSCHHSLPSGAASCDSYPTSLAILFRLFAQAPPYLLVLGTPQRMFLFLALAKSKSSCATRNACLGRGDVQHAGCLFIEAVHHIQRPPTCLGLSAWELRRLLEQGGCSH